MKYDLPSRTLSDTSLHSPRHSSHPLVIAGDGNVNGYGLEFYIETPADELPERPEEVARSWQFQLLYTVSQLAAGALDLCIHFVSRTNQYEAAIKEWCVS